MTHSDYLSTYRLDGYNPRLHMSVYVGAICASGTITATPSNPTTALAVSFSVGSASDVKPGFEIVIRTSGGLFKGRVRVRYTGSITSSSIPVRELGRGSVQVASGDLFEVRRYVPMDTKLTAADATFAPDGIPYSDQGSNPYPLACSGGAWAGWVNTGETFASVPTDGSLSTAVDPDSGGTLNHDWALPSGVAFQSGSASTDENPVLEVNQGSYLIQHDVEDDDNGKTATQYVPYIVHDAAHPPYEVLLNSYDGDDVNGVTWSVEVLDDDVTEEDIPELALCILWADDYFTHLGTVDMHRSAMSGRSHIVGIGYARRVTMSADYDTGERVVFEIQSPLARLSEIAGYSKVMLESATPDSWNMVKTLGFARGIIQNWQNYTTGTESGVDFVIDGSFADTRYPAHYLQRSDPVGQMRELADARQGRIVNMERGARLSVQYHPAYRPLADRTSVDITLTDDDAYDFDYAVELADAIEIFELRGVTAGVSGNASVYARSPSSAPGGGKNADVVERKSPDDQEQANDWCGMCYALREGVFFDANKVKHRVGELTLRCPGQYNVLDFIPDYIKFNHQGKRIDFDTYRFWLKRFSWEIDPDSGEPVTVFVWQTETAAAAGKEYFPPRDTGIIVEPLPWVPPSDVTLNILLQGIVPGSNRLALIMSNGHIHRTGTLRAAIPHFDDVDLTSIVGATILQWCYDARSPRSNVCGWVLTPTAIHYLQNLFGSVTATLVYTFAASSNRRNIDFDYIHAPGHFGVIVSNYGTTGIKVLITVDGANWGSEVFVPGSGRYVNGSEMVNCVPGILVDPNAPNTAYIGAAAAALDSFAYLFKTGNAGGSWSQDTSILDDETYLGNLYAPLGSSYVYYGWANIEASGGTFRNTVARAQIGSGYDEIGAIVSGAGYGPDWRRGRFGIGMTADDPRKLLYCGIDVDRTKRGVFLTDNAEAGSVSWTTVILPDVGVDYARCALVSSKEFYVFGLNGALGYSADGGATLIERNGDLVTAGEIVGIAG